MSRQLETQGLQLAHNVSTGGRVRSRADGVCFAAESLDVPEGALGREIRGGRALGEDRDQGGHDHEKKEKREGG